MTCTACSKANISSQQERLKDDERKLREISNEKKRSERDLGALRTSLHHPQLCAPRFLALHARAAVLLYAAVRSTFDGFMTFMAAFHRY